MPTTNHKRGVPIVVALALTVSLFATALPVQAAIYGNFDISEVYEASPELGVVADKVLMIVDNSDIACFEVNCSFDPLALEDDVGLSRTDPMDPYSDQNVVAICTAFLAGSSTGSVDTSDLVVTAGFCVDSYGYGVSSNSCSGYSLVAGWHLDDPTADPLASSVPASDVYTCAEVIVSVNTAAESYAVIRLDRPVNTAPLPLDRSASAVPLGTPVATVAHSAGLLAKASDGATVRYVRDGLIGANIDVYAGAAGAPLVRTDTYEVVGFLVYGNEDWRWSSEEGAYASIVYSDVAGNNKLYEEAMMIDRVTAYLNLALAVPTTDEYIADLRKLVTSLDAPRFLRNILLRKIARAERLLDKGSAKSALRTMKWMLRWIDRLDGRLLTLNEAGQLRDATQAAIDSINQSQDLLAGP